MVLFLLVLYAFSWLHEIGHVLGAILTGNEVYKIDVNILRGDSYVFYYNYSMKWVVCIMGSVLSLILTIPLLIYTFKKRNIWLLSIVYMQIAKETLYWGISSFTRYGDAYSLINWCNWFNLDVLVVVIKITAIISLIITVCLFIMMYHYSNKWLVQKQEEDVLRWEKEEMAINRIWMR